MDKLPVALRAALRTLGLMIIYPAAVTAILGISAAPGWILLWWLYPRRAGSVEFWVLGSALGVAISWVTVLVVPRAWKGLRDLYTAQQVQVRDADRRRATKRLKTQRAEKVSGSLSEAPGESGQLSTPPDP